MAQALLKKKALRLINRAKEADDSLYPQAVIKLGWSTPNFPKPSDVEGLLDRATNALVEEVIQLLKAFQGESQTRSPRLVAYQTYWSSVLEKVTYLSETPQYRRAALATEYQNVWKIAEGVPGEFYSRMVMYICICDGTKELDSVAAAIAQVSADEYEVHLKPAFNQAHRRFVLNQLVAMTPADVHPDVLAIRQKMRECLSGDYADGLTILHDWAERRRKQTQFANPNWIIRFFQQMELFNLFLVEDQSEWERCMQRYQRWQNAEEFVRDQRLLWYGQVVS